MYKTINFLFWYVFSASVWSSIIFCVTSLGAGKAGPPPVWLRLFLFTAASNFAVEQTFLHFFLICSTDLFLPTRPCIHRVYDLFPHFCLLCICYDICLFWSNYGYVFLHKLTWENQVSLGEIFTSPSFFFWADDFWHFFYQEYYGIMGYYPLVSYPQLYPKVEQRKIIQRIRYHWLGILSIG